MIEPQPPQTGGKPVSGLYVAVGLLIVAGIVLAILVFTSGVLA
ncbi:MAG: hypothetical protein U0838_06255 [Chloroflexota bacterium]